MKMMYQYRVSDSLSRDWVVKVKMEVSHGQVRKRESNVSRNKELGEYLPWQLGISVHEF